MKHKIENYFFKKKKWDRNLNPNSRPFRIRADPSRFEVEKGLV